jgi:hypothetical protein
MILPDSGNSAHILGNFYALSFFWLDGFAVPAPAQVTPIGDEPQTVEKVRLITRKWESTSRKCYIQPYWWVGMFIVD